MYFIIATNLFCGKYTNYSPQICGVYPIFLPHYYDFNELSTIGYLHQPIHEAQIYFVFLSVGK